MRILAILALGGCGFSARLGQTGDDVPHEAGVPREAGAPCMAWSFTPADFDPAALPRPIAMPELIPGDYTLDSDTGVIGGVNVVPFQLPYAATDVGIVSVEGFTLAAGVTLRGQGTRPLVIAVWGDLVVDGRVEVNTLTNTQPGAGASSANCGSSNGTDGSVNNGGDAGGGGGGFASPGGRGGNGSGIAMSGGPGGMMRSLPPRLAAGCRGGNAPVGDGGNPGDAGIGGGAIALVACEMLAVRGVVHAGGGGGTGGNLSKTGGGGGGSGGMIRLEARMITTASGAILAANGGQGGGGCDNGAANPGVDGLAEASQALSANRQGAGGDGGIGGWRDMPTGGTANVASDGGGGGGGGVGYVVYKGHASASMAAAISSPAASAF